MNDDDAKRRILARRAKFVAAAVAGLGAVTACDQCGPKPCLEPPLASTTPPGPCLSVSTVPMGVHDGAVIDPDAAPPPHPCLSIIRPVDDGGMPMPCLSGMAPPPKPSSKP